MGIVLTVAGVIGLLIFIVFGLLWLLAPQNRTNNAVIALVGALVWAIATVILALISLL